MKIYREIYGDPIYDTYEDDVDVMTSFSKKVSLRIRCVQNPGGADRLVKISVSCKIRFVRKSCRFRSVQISGLIRFVRKLDQGEKKVKIILPKLHDENPTEDSRTNLSWPARPDAA
ncbi:unnamed protein product [Microthlaspi erraticum]|uniref:Uncharacterized protein n=1 Tax=Microthlaspi erraticum TaxID=1685480 RepID=A0A6D2KYX7_9BRAS|nr:unnamed protein product [Microthlaspi erraticum]